MACPCPCLPVTRRKAAWEEERVAAVESRRFRRDGAEIDDNENGSDGSDTDPSDSVLRECVMFFADASRARSVGWIALIVFFRDDDARAAFRALNADEEDSDRDARVVLKALSEDAEDDARAVLKVFIAKAEDDERVASKALSDDEDDASAAFRTTSRSFSTASRVFIVLCAIASTAEEADAR